MKRNVIEINEDKCVGCGLCASACMQGAIEIIDGKAKLVSESYCDGLGMCLPKCPVDAIKVVEKDTEAFDKARKNIKAVAGSAPVRSDVAGGLSVVGGLSVSMPATGSGSGTGHSGHGGGGCGCAGSAAQTFERSNPSVLPPVGKRPAFTVERGEDTASTSELMQWPVQLRLVNPSAPYFENADLLIAADCTAFAYGDFHRDFIKGKITVIGCPKLDDNMENQTKIAEILKRNTIKSITVVRMEVPCCGGMIQAVRGAMLDAQCIVPYSEVTVRTDGSLQPL